MAIQPVEQGSAFAFRNVINNNFYELKVLSGASKPTQSTVAVVGQMYLDTSEGKMYFCSNVSGSVYTWKPFASDMSASNVSYNNGSSGMSSDNVQDAIDELFTSASNGKELIADAIAGKGVPTSANDTYATMAGNIEKIETGIDISDTTLTSASELKKDIVAYTKTGARVVGILGNGSVGAPSISINVTENNSKAEIRAITSYTSGIIGTNSTSSVKSLNVQQGTTITPGTSQKTAVATGKYTTGPVYVAGDSDLVPSNIKSGVNIFGVSGSYTGNISVIDINEDFVGASGTLWKVNISTAISMAYEGGLTPIQYPSQIKKILGLGGTIADGADTSRGGVVGGIWYRQSNSGGYHGLLSTNAIDGFYRTITSDVIVSGNNMIITLDQSYSGEGQGLDFNGILAFEY